MRNMSWAAWGALVALALAAGAGTAHAQYFGQNKVQYQHFDWRTIHSDHFEVYFYSGLDSVAMRVLDLSEKANVMLSKRMGHSLTHRVPIILYGSHNAFAQTNVTPELIDGSTGGFTEALRNRVVLPFTGSYEDLRHVVVHELTHAYMFDLIYQGNAASMIARQSFFSVPLWFAEGLAEYNSLGWESNAEMVVRDGTIEGYLPPLQYAGGYGVYKMGQSAIRYLVDTYGEDRLRDILQRIRTQRNFDMAFRRSVGMTVEKFDESWQEHLRKEYWPTVSEKRPPERFAKRLTDHRHDASNLNTMPSVSPQGDRVAYFSDRKQYTDIYVMSALDGKVLRRLIRGERSNQFEAIPSFRSQIAWSPDGERVAVTAKNGGRDRLYVVDAARGRVIREITLPCEALFYPAWSPVSDTIAITGLLNGRSDIWLVDASAKQVEPVRLTNDTWDEKEITFTPDGRSLTFSSDRTAPVVLEPLRQERGYGAYGIYQLDLASGATHEVIDTYGDDRAPVWSPNGEVLVFISDRNGTSNAYAFDTRDSLVTQLTDVTGGLQCVSWSRENDRVVFSAYDRGGYDIFAVRETISLKGVLKRLQTEHPEGVFTLAEARRDGSPHTPEPPEAGALAGAFPDTMTMAKDTTLVARDISIPPRIEAGGGSEVDSTGYGGATARSTFDEPPAWMGGPPPGPPVPPPAPPLPSTPLADNGGPFALPDSVLGQPTQEYHSRFAPDYAGGNLYGATGYGVGGTLQFGFSDFLGDRTINVIADAFSSSFRDLNAGVFYNHLPNRLDWTLGGFHSATYMSSTVSSLGEYFGGQRDYAERTFGVVLGLSYPFDKFRRIELGFRELYIERTFYAQNPFGEFVESGSQFVSSTSPTLSLVGDNTLYGYYGPVNGQRYNLTYSPSFSVIENGLSYHTVTFEGRRYWDLTRGYTFAGRVLAGLSEGNNAQSFRVGGFSTIRGYPDFQFYGDRVALANLEFRFPFIQQLGLVGPLPIGMFNIRGAVFGDAGMVWFNGAPLRFTEVEDGTRKLKDPLVGFGFGVRSAFYYMLLKLDCGWATNGHDTSSPRWYFSIGPEF